MDSAEFHAAWGPNVGLTGHIAKLVGMPNHSRHVGQALKFLDPNVNPPIPWHRVIGASGTISSRGPGTDGAQRQRDALEAEGVDVQTTRSGEMKIDLKIFGWFPDSLPAEQLEGDGEGGQRQ
ncbi:hypothetical protein CVT24_001807 [Panaeolus cyanescens]|uniref:Methylated-DNA-[protein]-cysteine S-methyltransferase DNA binding domain-containing protein n=1 Tax=Panaeolus cyanescens TaxID=181874 RepID=A0A409YFH1_9AGAR|nr:hypothetical protein CVT24_001807 [Panaeolus cyanescens]